MFDCIRVSCGGGSEVGGGYVYRRVEGSIPEICTVYASEVRLEASVCGHTHPLSGREEESGKVLESVDEYTAERRWLDQMHQQRNGAVLMWAGRLSQVLSQSSAGQRGRRSGSIMAEQPHGRRWDALKAGSAAGRPSLHQASRTLSSRVVRGRVRAAGRMRKVQRGVRELKRASHGLKQT